MNRHRARDELCPGVPTHDGAPGIVPTHRCNSTANHEAAAVAAAIARGTDAHAGRSSSSPSDCAVPTSQQPVIAGSDKPPENGRDYIVGAPGAYARGDFERGCAAGVGLSPEHDKQRRASTVLTRVASHLTTRSLPEPPPPPDGGFRAWAQVACGWLVIFTTWGYVNAFGAFQAYYTGALAPLPPSTISWIGSVQVFLTFCVGALSGRLLDAGLFTPTFICGTILQLLGVFLMSVSTQFWHLVLTQGVLTGLGGGLVFTPAMGLIATYFVKRRAVAVGLATTGNSVGGLLYPVIVRQLLPTVGFAWTTRVVGFVNLACLVTAAALMRPRLPPRTSGPLIDPTALRDPVYLLLITGLFFLLWGMYYSFYYIASFGTQILHMPYSTASLTVIIVNAAGLPTRLTTPFLAGRFGCINVVLPSALLVALTATCWLAVTNTVGYFAFAAAYGLANGAFHCLMPTVIASASPRLDMIGTRLGMAFAVIGVATLTGPPLGGALQGAMGGSFTGASIWAAAGAFVCVALFSVARGVLTGWKLRVVC
ncbi:hypothetical protein GGTG_02522 [Gaeumannomyces tritici R3-111a-1]|uniref:Major facilitator superfamily (MFS) profile domain-containing protein n=1 Tax=Gaeumannomyces tritici (strain R3-111a-1) TaxID=644352 RepID=J3NML6_GAET3|nr:hypothetical protein GGTG_02522 [Gaeumannomyces tritici R3-111a-1]EJT82549.1 hypothetical protein GGTG_02522 [Gaeumannomyces tritici R3-111a-1]